MPIPTVEQTGHGLPADLFFNLLNATAAFEGSLYELVKMDVEEPEEATKGTFAQPHFPQSRAPPN